jgi:hypothetical protein
MRRLTAMADRPQDIIGGGELTLSLSILDLGLGARLGEGCETEYGGFSSNFGKKREGKIEADPPKGRYVFVCTSFFVEALPKVRDWWEAAWRPAPRQVRGNCDLLWRSHLRLGRSRLRVLAVYAVPSLCRSDPA